MEQVTADQDAIDIFTHRVSNDAGETREEIVIPFRFTGGGAVGFAKMNI
jgi:hypothetical protein